eukprot:3124226-Amphidinium_carterae.1
MGLGLGLCALLIPISSGGVPYVVPDRVHMWTFDSSQTSRRILIPPPRELPQPVATNLTAIK